MPRENIENRKRLTGDSAIGVRTYIFDYDGVTGTRLILTP